MTTNSPAEFDYREHRCSNRKAARRVAQRHQVIELDRDAAWVAVRTADGRWVARRVPVGSEQDTKTVWERLAGAFSMLNWWPT